MIISKRKYIKVLKKNRLKKIVDMRLVTKIMRQFPLTKPKNGKLIKFV